ncbi:MAG: hypothetical protein ACFFAY_13990 [Promethearchaeota archaeon]
MIRLVARVFTPDMSFDVLYPLDERKDERIAILTGIVQLITAALNKGNPVNTGHHQLFYLKSATGVIGYFLEEDYLYLCEGDSEGETEDALKGILNELGNRGADLKEKVKDLIERPGKEVSDLWK